MIWTKHRVLLGSFCSSLGHLISVTPVLGAVQHSVGPGLRQCCPHIVTGLETSHPARNRPFLPTWRLRSALSRARWAIFPGASPCGTEVAKPPGWWPLFLPILPLSRAAAPTPSSDTNPFSLCPEAGTAQYGRVLPGTSRL